MKDSNEKSEEIKNPAPSPEPSMPPDNRPQAPFIPNMGLREVTATWEMLVNFKKAVLSVQWPGDTVQAVAMGLEMIRMMEGQYRVQVEMAREHAKNQEKKAREEIANAGGRIDGITDPVTLH